MIKLRENNKNGNNMSCQDSCLARDSKSRNDGASERESGPKIRAAAQELAKLSYPFSTIFLIAITRFCMYLINYRINLITLCIKAILQT